MITMVVSTILSFCGIIQRESFGTVELMMIIEVCMYPVIGAVFAVIRNRIEDKQRGDMTDDRELL